MGAGCQPIQDHAGAERRVGVGAKGDREKIEAAQEVEEEEAEMSDIVHWLRKLAALVEADHAPQHVVMHMRAGADEIERLRIRLEIDPSHPYDGIYCRDETIRGLEKEIERLRAGGCARDQGTTQYCAEAAKKDAEIASLLNALADARTESMRLRAALREIAEENIGNTAAISVYIARAALEGK